MYDLISGNFESADNDGLTVEICISSIANHCMSKVLPVDGGGSTEQQASRAQKMFDDLGIKNITAKVIPENGK
ncbi:hypothetical protein [Burkholderia ubonensis]|uniref:hypothetical protein n=1 Tax=Burkholderia ubonensis TaxID=101571 RepID=UPI0012FB9F38|nr:hypothetical protein [Burkholderia ubonensis]